MRKIVNAAKDIGDADQVTLALRDAYEHPELELYTSRINAAANSEESRVGRHAVQCMRGMVEKIATTKHKDQLDQKSRAVINIVGICLSKSGADASSVPPKNAIRRKIFESFSTGATHRILFKAGEKRKRFDKEDLSEF